MTMEDRFIYGCIAWTICVYSGGLATGLLKGSHTRRKWMGICLLCASTSLAGILLYVFTPIASGGVNGVVLGLLGLFLTLASAYGVYVAQLSETRLRATESVLERVRTERQATAQLTDQLERSLETYRQTLDENRRRLDIAALKQSILAFLPDDKDIPEEMREQALLIRSIVKSSTARASDAEARFDCEEVVSILEDHRLDGKAVLGKALQPFQQYSRIVGQSMS